MCGIAGFYGFEDKGLLKKMLNSIKHRGPDDFGTFEDNGICLGNRRLKIIDLSKNGRQPMSNEEGSIWITYNGEIYNFMELRKELEERGHRFKSKTDTEVIIHAYEEYGLNFVKKFRGMFAFALWDAKKKALILARDRIGKKPLYYYFDGEKFIFASEIKAILECDFVKREVDLEALYHYLTLINIPAPKTLFKGIFKLEPSTLMVLKNGDISKKVYWNIFDFKFEDFSEKEAVRKTQELLQDSVRLRMISDVPQAVFLSGGIDSSTIACLMAKASEEEINTLSIATGEGEKYNELAYAKIVAEKISSNHTEIIIGEKEFVDFLPALIHYQDEPIGDPINVPVYYLAKEARKKGIVVIHVGEGGDELFLGYPPYKIELNLHRLMRFVNFLPDFITIPMANLARLYNFLSGKDAYRHLYDAIKRYKEGDFPWHNLLGFTESEKKYLVSFNGKWNTYDFFRSISNKVSEQDSDDLFLQKERIIELKNRLPELLLMRTDKFTMANSVEARTPFLDHKLVEFELKIKPYSLHMKNGCKTILKKAVKDILPKKIIERKKIGFGIPISEHMNSTLKEVLANEMEEEEMRKLFKKEYVIKLIERHKTRGYGDTSMRTWILLNFALWHKYWIRKEHIRI